MLVREDTRISRQNRPKENGSPRVSVIMNCFNGEKYLRQAVESVIAQTWTDWELVFWDNQSSDKSADIFKSYDDPRLKYYLANEHTFISEAKNAAIAQAKGQLLAFLDVDDWWFPSKLESQIGLFDDPEVGIVCSSYRVLNETKGREWQALRSGVATGRAVENLLQDYFVALLTLMIRRSAMPETPTPFDPRYQIIADFDLVVRVAAEWKLGFSPEPTAVYRIHGNNESSKRREKLISERQEWYEEATSDPTLGGCKNLRWVAVQTAYIQAMHALLEGRRKEALSLVKLIPWCRLKFRLLVALVLPMQIVAERKN